MSETKNEMEEKILEAAITWTMEHPFQEPPLTQLAAMVGISGRTLSRYFPDKEDMLGLAAMRYLTRKSAEHAQTIEAMEENDSSTTEQIRAMFCSMRSLFQNDPGAIRIYASANMRCINYTLKHQLPADPSSEKVQKSLFALLEKGKQDGSLRSDLDNAMTVELILTGFNGLMHRIAITYTSVPDDQEKENAARLYKEFMKMLEWYLSPRQ